MTILDILNKIGNICKLLAIKLVFELKKTIYLKVIILLKMDIFGFNSLTIVLKVPKFVKRIVGPKSFERPLES